ncbi:MAG: outer membrane protein assembly factor BamB family protein [Planctomycetota bacterium]
MWRRRLPGGGLTAPVCAKGRVFVGATDGTVRAFDSESGEILWQVSSNAAVLHPPAYWNGRVIFGSCDGVLYCVDASDGRLLGRAELAPEKRHYGPAHVGLASGRRGSPERRRDRLYSSRKHRRRRFDCRRGGRCHRKIPLAADIHSWQTELRCPGKHPDKEQHAVHQRRRSGGNRGAGRAYRRQSQSCIQARSGNGNVSRARR